MPDPLGPGKLDVVLVHGLAGAPARVSRITRLIFVSARFKSGQEKMAPAHPESPEARDLNTEDRRQCLAASPWREASQASPQTA